MAHVIVKEAFDYLVPGTKSQTWMAFKPSNGVAIITTQAAADALVDAGKGVHAPSPGKVEKDGK